MQQHPEQVGDSPLPAQAMLRWSSGTEPDALRGSATSPSTRYVAGVGAAGCLLHGAVHFLCTLKVPTSVCYITLTGHARGCTKINTHRPTPKSTRKGTWPTHPPLQRASYLIKTGSFFFFPRRGDEGNVKFFLILNLNSGRRSSIELLRSSFNVCSLALFELRF